MRIIIVCVALLSAACDRDGPPAPSPEQSNQLDEAEAMLDELAEKEKGAVSADAAPSSSN